MAEIEATFHKAEQLRESGNNEEALKEYTKVVYFAPRHWPAYFHLGSIFGASGHNELAISLLHRAAAINPENHVIKNHLADYMMKLKQHAEAIVQLKASWSIDSSAYNSSAPLKIGRVLWETNRPREAMPYFDLVLASKEASTQPNNQASLEDNQNTKHVARWLRGLCLMSLGDYQAAWEDYESRVNLPGVITPELAGEKWLGQPLDGKTIFFAYEQRFGDIIQFLRFIPRLTTMGAKVILQLPPELKRQVSHSFPDIELVLTTDPVPEYDFHQLMTSIPSVLNLDKKETLSDPVPYFGVAGPDANAHLPMRNDTLLKVGLVWEGKPDPDRSIPLLKYIPLLKHQSVSFFSFQLGDKRKQLHENAAAWLIHDLAPNISDFYDSSIMLKEMDLLITIDTAIAHQAGALGVPVWVMLRYFSDWRWETKREDNVWYPSMRLFRQQEEGSWEQTGRQLEHSFDEWVSQTIKKKSK